MEGQNSLNKINLVVGKDKKGHPIYEEHDVTTTMTQLIISKKDGTVVYCAGVQRAADFDYDALLNIALKGVTIEA